MSTESPIFGESHELARTRVSHGLLQVLPIKRIHRGYADSFRPGWRAFAPSWIPHHDAAGMDYRWHPSPRLLRAKPGLFPSAFYDDFVVCNAGPSAFHYHLTHIHMKFHCTPKRVSNNFHTMHLDVNIPARTLQDLTLHALAAHSLSSRSHLGAVPISFVSPYNRIGFSPLYF
ncbi:hypothetical protein HBI44_238510 [Parastagonospora nodorum]|nr:hypothetical protein HBI44_238510 [Parastagonospora nodorum]